VAVGVGRAAAGRDPVEAVVGEERHPRRQVTGVEQGGFPEQELLDPAPVDTSDGEALDTAHPAISWRQRR
jgi:hypothetical protein